LREFNKNQQNNCNSGICAEKRIMLLLVIAIVLICTATLLLSVNTGFCGSKENDAAFDFSSPPKTRIQLTPDLSFGGRVELEYQLEKNFHLDAEDCNHTAVWKPSASMAFSYACTEKSTAFLNIELSQSIEENKEDNETMLELQQAFLSFTQIIDGLDMIIGRQRFRDKREWLYDEELDGVNLSYGFSDFALDFSVNRKPNKDILNHKKNKKVTNYLLYGRYTPGSDTIIGAYNFFQDDRGSANKSSIFYGLHLSGEMIHSLKYWLELAHVRGRSKSNKIRGIGFDLGSTYKLDLPLRPSITLGCAFGSGDDDPLDNENNNFRQTGLQDNSAKFNGVTHLKYYGEMFDPELSNLVILTAGFGLKSTRKISIDLVCHHYNQHKLSDRIRDSKIDRDPNGLSKDIGKEIDLVAGYKSKRLKSTVSIGYFMPGKAFSDNTDNALFAEIKICYDF